MSNGQLNIEPNPLKAWISPCMRLLEARMRAMVDLRRRFLGDETADRLLYRDLEAALAKSADKSCSPEQERARIRWLNDLLLCPGERFFCDDVVELCALQRQRDHAARCMPSAQQWLEVEYVDSCREFLLARRRMRQEVEAARLARIMQHGGVHRLTEADHIEIAEADFEVDGTLRFHMLSFSE